MGPPYTVLLVFIRLLWFNTVLGRLPAYSPLRLLPATGPACGGSLRRFSWLRLGGEWAVEASPSLSVSAEGRSYLHNDFISLVVHTVFLQTVLARGLGTGRAPNCCLRGQTPNHPQALHLVMAIFPDGLLQDFSEFFLTTDFTDDADGEKSLAAENTARLTPQPKKMEDRGWKIAKAASASVSMIWDGLREKFAQENKTFRDSSAKLAKRASRSGTRSADFSPLRPLAGPNG